MKRTTILSMLLWIPILITAQQKVSFQATTQLGYDYNIARNPKTYATQENHWGKEDLILSAPFAKIGLGMDFQKKMKKKHIIDWGVDLGYQLYPTLFELNLLNMNQDIKYRYKLSKKMLLFGKVSIRYTHRTEFESEGNIHNITNPYLKYGVGAGLEFKANKWQKYSFEAQQSWKQYRSFDDTFLSYSELFLKGHFRQKIKEGPITQLETSMMWKQRNYISAGNSNSIVDEDLLGEDIFEETEQYYRMNYLTINGILRFKISKYSYLKPSLEYVRRTSKDRSSLQYNQYASKLDWVYQKKKTMLKVRSSYAFRKYSSFTPTSGTSPLQYNYIKGELVWEQQIRKKIYFTTALNVTKRLSNFNGDARLTNRSYLQGSALVGITINF